MNIPRFVSRLFPLLFVLAGFVPAEAKEIPDGPKDATFKNFVWDYVGVLNDDADQRRITGTQRVAFNEHDTPIIVVVIDNMAEYEHNGSIAAFAKKWFDKWRIGTLNNEGGQNTGMLLLVAIGDREARIELGADWGRAWNNHAQQIMDRQLIPHFKQGDYSGGIAAGVEQLGNLAATGPEGQPPQVPFAERVERAMQGEGDGVSKFSPWPAMMVYGGMVIGVLLMIGSIFVPEHRKWMLIAGAIVFGLALIPFIVAFIALMFGSRNANHGGSGGSFGGFSGGGFSGGFSGGGGASGSW